MNKIKTMIISRNSSNSSLKMWPHEFEQVDKYLSIMIGKLSERKTEIYDKMMDVNRAYHAKRSSFYIKM